MKYLLFSLMFACSMNAQTRIHFYYAPIEQTTGAEVLIPVRNTSISLGGGFSGAWDVVETLPSHINEYDLKQGQKAFREEWTSLYATCSFGYFKDFLIKYRGGLAVYQDKVTFNSDYTKLDKIIYLPMIGVSAMYYFDKDFGIEAGFDTFNKLTFGLTVNF